MADKPIIFSAPMVRALLDGRKTQTRRLLGPGNTLFNGRPWTKLHKAQVWAWEDAWVDPGPSPAGNPGPYLKLPWASGHEVFEDTVHRIYPAIQPGDRLWVKERAAWVSAKGWRYMADNDDFTEEYEMGEVGKWCSPIFMRRRASRLTLTVTDVRVHRLQEISEADAVAEGIEDGGCTECGGSSRASEGCCYDPSPDFRDSFAFLWNSLHGPDAWDSNPWVVALTFKVQRGNIDTMEASK